MKISKKVLRDAKIEVFGNWDNNLPKVTQDSREVVEGGLFWALVGENSDGHAYVEAALKDKKAGIVAVNYNWYDKSKDLLEGHTVFVMEDTLVGLQSLATQVRKSLGSIVVAITGSNGKTTTREMIATALSAAGKTGKNIKNYNNHIGLPLSILNLDGDEKYVVLELGANHIGEIEELSAIAQPGIGLITNIGSAHLGEFGGIDEVQKAKGELFEYVSTRGMAVVNLDDDRVVQAAFSCPQKVGFTLSETPASWSSSIYSGKIISQDKWGRPTLAVEGMTLKLKLPGRHFASGALAAYTVGIEAGVDPGTLIQALETVEPLAGRGMIIGLDRGIELMDESYNANASSIETALNSLARHDGYTIAVLGDVFELGAYEEEEHRRIGRFLSLEDVDRVYFVGSRMAWAAEEADLSGHPWVERMEAEDVADVAAQIAEDCPDNTAILVKGSRAMGLERVVLGLARKFKPKAEGGA